MVSRENKELIFALVLLLQYEREKFPGFFLNLRFSDFRSQMLFFPPLNWRQIIIYICYEIYISVNMFAHVGELWPLKLQRSILFDVNKTATCLSDAMWPYVYLNEGVYKFPFQKNPREKFPGKFDEFPFYLVTMLFTCPITSTVGRCLKIVTHFQNWEDYLSADCQLEELWWIVEDREGENWENVHPCRPQVRHLDEIVHSIVDCK